MKLFGRRESFLEAEQKLEKTERLLMDTRETIGSLRVVMSNIKTHMNELEAELQSRKEEV